MTNSTIYNMTNNNIIIKHYGIISTIPANHLPEPTIHLDSEYMHSPLLIDGIDIPIMAMGKIIISNCPDWITDKYWRGLDYVITNGIVKQYLISEGIVTPNNWVKLIIPNGPVIIKDNNTIEINNFRL